MYVFSYPNQNSFQKVGISWRIYPTTDHWKSGQFVRVSTEKWHETVIRFTETTMSYYVVAGDGIFTIDHTDYPVKKDDIVIIPPTHDFTYTGKMELLLLTTPPYMESDEIEVGKNPKWESYVPPVEKSEHDTLKDSLARSQADYQNLLMRIDRDKAEMVSFLSGKILAPLLTQVDNLERAVKLKEGVTGDAFVDGVRSMLASMEKYLESQGVVAFVSIGQEVDPDKHEVLTQMSGEEGKILQEFEKGYMLRDRVLRHAKVVVGSGE